jgi:hypothetical protein
VSVSIDFIVSFLKVDDMDTIMIIVETLTKYIMFVITLIVYTTKVAAGLFYQIIVKYFEVPADIVSDRNV